MSFTITIISTVPTESSTANRIRFNFKIVVLPPTFPQPRDHHLHHVFVSLPTVLHRIVPKIPHTLFPRPRVGCGGHSFYTIQEARLASEDNAGPGLEVMAADHPTTTTTTTWGNVSLSAMARECAIATRVE